MWEALRPARLYQLKIGFLRPHHLLPLWTKHCRLGTCPHHMSSRLDACVTRFCLAVCRCRRLEASGSGDLFKRKRQASRHSPDLARRQQRMNHVKAITKSTRNMLHAATQQMKHQVRVQRVQGKLAKAQRRDKVGTHSRSLSGRALTVASDDLSPGRSSSRSPTKPLSPVSRQQHGPTPDATGSDTDTVSPDPRYPPAVGPGSMPSMPPPVPDSKVNTGGGGSSSVVVPALPPTAAAIARSLSHRSLGNAPGTSFTRVGGSLHGAFTSMQSASSVLGVTLDRRMSSLASVVPRTMVAKLGSEDSLVAAGLAQEVEEDEGLEQSVGSIADSDAHADTAVADVVPDEIEAGRGGDADGGLLAAPGRTRRTVLKGGGAVDVAILGAVNAFGSMKKVAAEVDQPVVRCT